MRILFLTILFILCGCVSVPVSLETPLILVGTAKNPEFTSWYRDVCVSGKLVRDRYVSAECLPHGGEIYKVTLTHARTLDGERVHGAIDIAYPAHALASHAKWETDVFLQPTPENFREASGIEYIATAYGNLNDAGKCLVERGYGHIDNNLCTNPDFHKDHFNECVPVSKFVSHYAEGT